MKKELIFVLGMIFLLGMVSAADFTPQGDINLRGVYQVKNATNISAQNITAEGYFFGDGSELTNIVASTSNSSTYWAGFNDTNSTQFESQGGALHIVTSWLESKINSLLIWTSISGRPTHLTNFTDDINYSEKNTNSSDFWDALNTPSDIALNDLGDALTGSKTFTLGGNTLTWRFTNPVGGVAYNWTGAASGHLFELFQSGNSVPPGAGTHLLHIEAEDSDVVPLHVAGTGGVVILAEGGIINATDGVYSNGEAVLTTSNLSEYSTTAQILAFGYYNASDFVITDYFTKSEILGFGYYNSSDFDIADYFTSAEVLGFGYYNASDFDINDYFTKAEVLGFNYYNSTDFVISDYYTKTEIDGFDYYNASDFVITDYYTKSEVYNKTEVDDLISAIGPGGNIFDQDLNTTDDVVFNNVNATGDLCITGGTCLSEAGTGSGDITEVNTPDDYLYGGQTSGAVSLYLNTTTLDQATNDSIDARVDQTFLQTILDTVYHPLWDYDYGDLINTPTIPVLWDAAFNSTGDSRWVQIANLVSLVGNWSADKGDYYTSAQVDSEISSANTSVVNWVDALFPQTSELVGLLGNWSADKSDYSTTAEADLLYAGIEWDYNQTTPAITAANAYTDSGLAAQDACSEITGCVENAITSLAEDSSPQLGGYLDTNGQNIGSTADEIENVYVATNARIYFGDGQEASAYYNGTNLIISG